MVNLVGLDRDGLLVRDDNYYLGSQENWRELVEIIEGVPEGIIRLNRLGNTYGFIISNQSGVALQGPKFDSLNEERMFEVNEHIVRLLEIDRAKIRGSFLCPFVDSAYAEKARAKGRIVNPHYVKNGHRDMKPRIGMLEKAAASLGVSLDVCNVFMIGDRLTDVMTGLNAGGAGILVPSGKTGEEGDIVAVRDLAREYGERVYIAEDFLDAVRYVEERINR